MVKADNVEQSPQPKARNFVREAVEGLRNQDYFSTDEVSYRVSLIDTGGVKVDVVTGLEKLAADGVVKSLDEQVWKAV